MKLPLHYCSDCQCWHEGPCPFDEADGGASVFLVIAGIIVAGAIWLLIWILS